MVDDTPTYTAFAGPELLASGPLSVVAAAAAAALRQRRDPLVVFEDSSGEQVELDLRGGPEAAVAEFQARTGTHAAQPRPGRGRPKLGVVAREVTLLPRHWAWLATQPGGASAALRRLVEDARRMSAAGDRARQARDALYRVMSVLAGDLPGFEEATRALYAARAADFEDVVRAWPRDIAGYVSRLAQAERAAR
jgi:uncharacterized protein